MNLKFLKMFEEFEEGKFSMDDISDAMKRGKSVFTSIVKEFPKHNPQTPIKVVDLDYQTGEVVGEIDNNIYYIDSKNIEEIQP